MQLTDEDGDCNGCGANNGKLYGCPDCKFVACFMCLLVWHPSDNVSNDTLTDEVQKILAKGAQASNLSEGKNRNSLRATDCEMLCYVGMMSDVA